MVRIVCVCVAVLAALADVSVWAQGAGAPPPQKVFVESLQEAEVSEGHSFVGTVEALRKSTVGSAAAGRVEEFLVNQGDRVEKGQPIARLRTGIIEAEVNHAKAELRARQAELQELENGSRPEELEQARAALEEAEAARQMRFANKERTEALGVAATRRQLDEDQSLAKQSDAAFRNAKATLALLEVGPRKEKIAQAKALVDAQSAEVERLSEQLNRHTMFAPFDGYVTSEFTEVGHWLMQGDPVAEIVEVDEVDIVIPVLEDYVTGVSLGETARVEVSALPDCVLTGQVAAIVPLADARARTFPVRIRVANRFNDTAPQLKVGMFARVTLPVGKPAKALLAPKDALVLGGPSPVLFVVDTPDGGKEPSTVRPVPIQLGISKGDQIQVIGDLKPGQAVVVEGNERLRPGQPVRPEARAKKAAAE